MNALICKLTSYQIGKCCAGIGTSRLAGCAPRRDFAQHIESSKLKKCVIVPGEKLGLL